MRPSSPRAAWVAVAALASSVACSDPPATGRAAPRASTAPGPAVVPAQPPAPRCGSPQAAGARVVVDVSRSMQGFASEHAVTLGKVHEALDLALGAGGIATPLQRCTLGEELDCATPRTREQFNAPTLYTASNCRLDRAIRVPPPIDPHNPPPDNLDPYRAVVILTDGMQSASGPAAVGRDPVAACNSGADPNCVRLLLQDRIAHGYGVWLVLMFLPFEGRHFAEQGLDDETYDGIRAHVQDAALRLPYSRPAFPVAGGRHHARRPASTLEVGREYQVDRRNALASYEYRGWKPLLAWVISCDRQTGDQLVENFRAQLVAQGVVAEQERQFFSVRVAPMSGQPHHFGPMTRVGAAAGQVDVGRPQRGAGAGQVQRVTCDTEGRATLRVPVVPGPREYPNPDFVRDAVSLEFQGRPLSRAALSSPQPGDGGMLRALRCERFPAGVHRETMVLASALSLGEIPADVWWREFDAPNSFAAPERVFGLRPLAEGLLAEGAKRQFVWDTFTIEVERQ